MHVNRLRLLGVRSLWQDLPERSEPLPEAAHARLLLRGPNGSGKSTVLDTVAVLWRQFGEWIDRGPQTDAPLSLGMPFRRSHIARADLAAVEIVGHPVVRGSLWIGVGRRNQWDALKAEHPGSQFAGAIRASEGWDTELPSFDWREHRNLSLVGKVDSPNIVYFPPEDRYAKPRSGLLQRPAQVTDVTDFNWLAKPEARTRFEDVVLTMGAVRPKDYETFRSMVNMCLRPTRKQLRGFNERGYLVVRGERQDGKEFEHKVDDLSSGERQMLLVLGFAIAFLRPGGIVLIDEPDLHIHTAMTTQLMQMLDHIVRERRGQLIAASHSETVWEYFSRTTERLDLGVRPGGAV